MSEDTMVNSLSSTTPSSTTTVDLPSSSTGREPSSTSSLATGDTLKDTVITLDKMLRYATQYTRLLFKRENARKNGNCLQGSAVFACCAHILYFV